MPDSIESITEADLERLADHHERDVAGWRAAAIRLLPALLAKIDEQGGEIFSDTTVDGVRLTWREIALRQRSTITNLGRWQTICQDLDRCEHGRHEGDVCSGCDGPSIGNDLSPHGRAIGYDIGGLPYFVPTREEKYDPARWRGAR